MNKMSRQPAIRKQSGFTLVELMVTLVVAFLVIAAVYASFKVQQQNEKAQQQVSQIQQNLRAAMDMISREFPMAGYDPLQSGYYEIKSANSNSFHFTVDLDEDGNKPDNDNWSPGDPSPCAAPCTTPEIYYFTLFDPAYADDNDISSLSRIPDDDALENYSAVADNIDQIEFRYLQANGTPTAVLNDIVAVRVTILARADEPDFKYTDNNTYSTTFTTMDGTVVAGTTWDPADFAYPNNLNYRRRMLAKTIYLRNIGLF